MKVGAGGAWRGAIRQLRRRLRAAIVREYLEGAMAEHEEA